MKGKVKKNWFYATQPRIIILFVALLNFIWFFYHSRIVQEFGSDAIGFCVVCAWYWDWTLTNLPSLSLAAASFLLIQNWKGYLMAVLINGYQLLEGIRWLCLGRGFIGGLSQRYEIISKRIDSEIWQFLDWQYLLAMIIFITALSYLIADLKRIRQNPKIR